MKSLLKQWAFWSGSILLWELILHVHATPEQPLTALMVVFSLAAALVFAALSGLGKWLHRLLPPVVLLVYVVQLVYCEIFGSYLSISFAVMGGDAVTEFFGILVDALLALMPRLALMAVPLLVNILAKPGAGRLSVQAAALAAGVACLAGVFSLAGVGQVQPSVDHWAARFGILAAEVLDVRQVITGGGSSFVLSGDGDWQQYGAADYQVMEQLDLDLVAAAAEQADREDILELNRYLMRLEPTQKHPYTGYFEGCNLIMLCAESFSPYMIDPELTPTLYRLSNEGFVFRNFYCSFPNVTTNGEYGYCMGTMPDFSRMSFQMSVGNYLPFTLGNFFRREGITPLAYHNNIGTFYHREQTHVNMGYAFRAIGMGLDMVKRSPASDLEMMEKTLDEYIGSEPFHAYYMTYSGHAPYDFTQDMAEQNRSLVDAAGLSEGVHSYLAANLELERALAYLVQRLEEAGIAERTVIVLSADHIPYGLSDEDYAALAGDAVREPLWKYRSSFICWKGGMDPIVVDSYGCSQDVLPTVLNLFGFEYDSRLLTGRDLLAPGPHVALNKDGSFLSEGVYYDGVSGTAVWSGEEDPGLLQELLTMTGNQFAAASALLETDYARFAYEALGIYDGGNAVQVACFSDIADKWYRQTVEELYRCGVLNGSQDARFRGDEAATRAELAVLLSRGMQMPNVTVELPYPDLTPGKWYTDGIRICYDAGLLPQQWESGLLPNVPIRQEEAAYILEQAADHLRIPGGKRWVKRALEEVLELQAEHGTDGDVVTRAAVAELILWMRQQIGI